MTLAGLASGPKVPPEIFNAGPMTVAEHTASDYACLLNDVFSYQKEIKFGGRVHNGVLSVQQFLNCDLGSAVRIVNDLMTARLREFERAVTDDLPALAAEYGLDIEAKDGLHEYVTQLQDWLARIVHWHRNCGRYTEPDGPAPARLCGRN